MQRVGIEPRPDWQGQVEKWGLVYHTFEGQPYWDESAYFILNEDDVDALEESTNELHRLCLAAIDEIFRRDFDPRWDVPESAFKAARRQWQSGRRHLYGRFDLAYTGDGPPKLLEYNADTPTALLEAAVVQWQWLQDRFPGADQFNSIWEELVNRWSEVVRDRTQTLYFAHEDWPEDIMTIALLRDAAEEAGLSTESIFISDVGWNAEKTCFTALDEQPMSCIFKLYPWENMLREPFGAAAVQPGLADIWIEPIWKVFLSNKAILPLLWEMFPDHPNLLEAYSDGPHGMTTFVKKPCYSREGAGVTISGDGETIAKTPESENHTRFIYQQYSPLFSSEFGSAVIGSWVVGDTSCGIGIRESTGPITVDKSRFVPHRIVATLPIP